MKYTLKTLILTLTLLSSVTAYSASQVNWFNNQTKTQTSQSRWSPVSSDINVTSSRANNRYDYINRRYYSGGVSYSAPVTNRSFYSTDRCLNQSVRVSSVASKTHYKTNDLRRNSAFNATLADNSNLEFVTNDFFEDDENDEGGRAGQQRIRRGATANPGDTAAPTPLSDAVPCLVIMILAVAVVKYRKLH